MMIKILPSLVIGLIVVLQLFCPSICQYILNVGMAIFAIHYIFRTIDRISRKEWHNDYITKRERSRVLYIAVCLLFGFAVLNVAWLIQTYDTSHGEYVIISSLLDKAYTLYEALGLIFAVYVTFQINLELNQGIERREDEGFVTMLLKGRYYKQAGETNEPKNN